VNIFNEKENDEKDGMKGWGGRGEDTLNKM